MIYFIGHRATTAYTRLDQATTNKIYPFKALETTIKKQDDEIERLKNTQKVIKISKLSSHKPILSFTAGGPADPGHGSDKPAEAGDLSPQ